MFPCRSGPLCIRGFIGVADAARRRFGDMVQLVLMEIRAREDGMHHSPGPDLRAARGQC
ncbi:hypothetical protein [Paeniglutamicibacter cryotolerans]|uniref:Uncharacterized protein n=1 Tax=Paeniglutamicibacter cryotolerans TaxID=670079 RepID=A0A839QNN6_9MICC|nr:hypothetical protein [Paeniglutamicibacter cryotolerans]MBB2996245.1 hypothetical protein [Paeniglutamicibacter cryotolerans]